MKIDEIQPGEPLRILALRPDRKESNKIISQIEKQLPKGSKIITAGNKNTDIVMSGLIRVKRKRGRIKDLIKENRFSGKHCVQNLNTTFNETAFVAIDHLQRRTAQFTWRYHTLENAHDAKHYYHIVLDLLANLLVKERINLVIFFELPHLFYDMLIYQIAKSMGVRTLVFTNSRFPNRFFSLGSIEDIGITPSGRSENPIVPYPINPDENPDWEYMKGIKQFRGDGGKLRWRGFLRLFWSFVTTERKKLLNPKFMFRTISRMRMVAAELPEWRDPFRRHFHTSHLDYYETILKYENKEIDFNRKFVYFPLQFQPELTTSTLGGYYSDQLLAIEHLSSILPEDCWIYVKENPKQTGAMRGPHFFERLGRIPNLEFLPSYANTHELTKKSQFVATITGTVGWEAICKGKNALVFGMPWYRNLQGVVEFQKGIKYETVLNYKIEHFKLEQEAGNLFARSHSTGALASDMKSPPRETNKLNTVAESVVNLIENRIETTFMRT